MAKQPSKRQIAAMNGTITVGVRRRPDREYRIVYRGFSSKYAATVARKYAKEGYDAVIDEVQQEDA
jgi:hypothetical protein